MASILEDIATLVGTSIKEDRDRLDALESGKLDSSSFTGSNILTQLLTVDTNTSGLNANTLQGNTAAAFVLESERNAANGFAGLDASGKVASSVLPSYIDDVVEYADLASFPATGEASVIYVALDTNKTYRWSSSVYVEISPSDVNSVAGKTGNVTLTKSDVGLANVDNTADASKAVLSATRLATARTISLTGDASGSVSFNGTANVSISVTVANDSHTHAFANITGKPTTLSGYGITDAYTEAEIGTYTLFANALATALA